VAGLGGSDPNSSEAMNEEIRTETADGGWRVCLRLGDDRCRSAEPPGDGSLPSRSFWGGARRSTKRGTTSADEGLRPTAHGSERRRRQSRSWKHPGQLPRAGWRHGIPGRWSTRCRGGLRGSGESKDARAKITAPAFKRRRQELITARTGWKKRNIQGHRRGRRAGGKTRVFKPNIL
jgi:hypothetical protein